MLILLETLKAYCQAFSFHDCAEFMEQFRVNHSRIESHAHPIINEWLLQLLSEGQCDELDMVETLIGCMERHHVTSLEI